MGTMKARIEVRHYVLYCTEALHAMYMYDTVHRALINRYTHTYVFSHTQRPGDWCNNSVVYYTDFTYSIIILQRHCWWTSHYIQPENLPPLFSQKPRPFRTTLDLLSPTQSTSTLIRPGLRLVKDSAREQFRARYVSFDKKSIINVSRNPGCSRALSPKGAEVTTYSSSWRGDL